MLVRNGLFLVIMCYLLYVIFQPHPESQPLHQYLGDPMTGCAYPVESLDLNKLFMYSEGEMSTHWDEFISVEQAKDAGYHPCTGNYSGA